MRRSRSIVFAVWAALLLEGAAFGKDAMFQSPDRGLANTLKREGCRPEWLASTMRLSGILPSDLTRLKWNTAVILPDDCAKRPKRGIRQDNRRIVGQIRAITQNQSRVAELMAENEKLRTRASGAEEAAKIKVAADMKKLEDANAQLIKDNRKLSDEVRRATVQPVFGVWSLIWSAAGVIIIGLLWFVRERHLRKSFFVVRRKIDFWHSKGQNDILVFPLSQVDPITGVPSYHCALHGECQSHNIHASGGEPLDAVIDRHLAKSHGERLVTVTYKNVKSKNHVA